MAVDPVPAHLSTVTASLVCTPCAEVVFPLRRRMAAFYSDSQN